MKVLINLATLKKGGGQNVGLNLIQAIISSNCDLNQFYFVVAEKSEIHCVIQNSGIMNFTAISANPLIRMIEELLKGRRIIRKNGIDIIYTVFGIGLYPSKIKQISGSADSNIFYPEVNFWEHNKGVSLIRKIVVDKYRVFALKKATAVIFENESMRKRAVDLYNLTHTKFIKPSFCAPLERGYVELPTGIGTKKGLFFCGWQKNKNYQIIPHVARELKARNIKFHFVITAPKDNSVEHVAFKKSIHENEVGDMISIIGPVTKFQIPSLYEYVDFVFLLSKLESFSNNIIEAWYYQRPLIIAREDWSISLCGKSAYYVSRNDAINIADGIEYLLSNYFKTRSLTRHGIELLSSYPSIMEKLSQELSYIKEVYETH